MRRRWQARWQSIRLGEGDVMSGAKDKDEEESSLVTRHPAWIDSLHPHRSLTSPTHALRINFLDSNSLTCPARVRFCWREESINHLVAVCWFFSHCLTSHTRALLSSFRFDTRIQHPPRAYALDLTSPVFPRSQYRSLLQRLGNR